MAAIDNFRSSLHGFNRTDVVQFIQQQTANHDKAMRMQKEESTRLQDALTEARAEIERLTAENEAVRGLVATPLRLMLRLLMQKMGQSKLWGT